MENIQPISFWKKPSFILSLIIIIFVLKGIFLSSIFPMFEGQDEARHYNTIQFILEPKEKTWPITENSSQEKGNFETYNFSEEIRETAKAISSFSINDENYNKLSFSESYLGKNEYQIASANWSKFNSRLPIDIAGESGLYHILASRIEKLFSSESIAVRFHLIRFFSIFLGMLSMLLCYFIAKNIGLSPKASLLLTAIASFQPKFSIYHTNINYDALLILSFSLFTLAGVLIIKNGLTWKNFLIACFSVGIGLSTKGTAMIILMIFVLLLIGLFYKKIGNKIIFFLVLSIATFLLLRSNFSPLNFLPINEVSLHNIALSLKEYFVKSMTFGRFEFSAKVYWGYIGWNNSWFYNSIMLLIWPIELLSAVGLGIFFISKRKVDFLPEKKFIFFLLTIIGALQLGIRSFDWTIFSQTGGLDLGTPGRYFLPTMIPQLILIFTGLGMLLKKRVYFESSLIAGLILMFAFSLYIIFDVIMPRFYL